MKQLFNEEDTVKPGLIVTTTSEFAEKDEK